MRGNLSLSKDRSEEVEAFLLALVFLVMVLRKGQGTQKRKKPRTNCKLTQKKNIGITIYMTHEQINVMMHALMQ